ncbi:MAG: T6SS effector BTH_I2691 family protein [Pseudomonas sp.]
MTNQLTPHQARRNQLFEDRPMSATAQCPLKAREVAIFPVRYAVDESPPKGTNQGPNPLPDGFDAAHLPALETRSYTLRQIRDGWLYVWDATAQTLHEYSVKGHLFTRLIWSEQDIGQDARNTEGETHPYLLYPRGNKLHIAYSPVQWTWRICELMRSNPSQQAQWMRELDLPSFCATLEAPHGASLRTLADCVADISPSGQVPSFNTTLIPTEEPPEDPDAQSDPTATKDPAMQFKPGISDALVLGAVPDQDTALFIALDDPIGVINDLTMHHTARWSEISQFEEEHRNSLQTALAVQQSCGVNLDAVIPPELTQSGDIERMLEFTKDAHTYLGAYAHIKFNASNSPQPGVAGGAAAQIQRDQSYFQSKWKVHPTGPTWHGLAVEWDKKGLWRSDVQFNEVRTFLHERAAELKQLRLHVQHIENDMIGWLSRLRPDAHHLFYDTANVDQSAQLMDWAESLFQVLGAGSNHEPGSEADQGTVLQYAQVQFQGGEWLYKEFANRTTLLGLALFNFNTELAEAIDLISYNYVTSGTIDGRGQQADTSGKINTGTDFIQEVLSASDNVNELLNLELVRRSAIYQALSEHARKTLEALRTAAAGPARSAWNAITTILLPALASDRLSDVRVFAFSSTIILFTTEIAEHVSLLLNPAFDEEVKVWKSKKLVVQKDIRALSQNRGPGVPKYDMRARERQQAGLQTKLQDIDADPPKHIIGAAAGRSYITNISVQQIDGFLVTAGQSAVQAHLRQRAASAAVYGTQAKAWMDVNLGGAFPVLLAALSIWNFKVTLGAVTHDGYISADERQMLLTGMSGTLGLLMAVWVLPLWNRWSKYTGVIDGTVLKLTEAGARAWGSAGQLNHASLARKLILRTVGMAAFNAIAAGSEIIEINKKLASTTSSEQKAALLVKQGALAAIGGISGLQILGASLGFFFGFAWVMGTALVAILAIAGVIYLISAVVANHYHREGLRLWLYQCRWGKAPKWEQSDDGHAKELWALSSICLRPAVSVRATFTPHRPGGRSRRVRNGFWLQLAVPASLSGQRLELQALLTRKENLYAEPRLEGVDEGVYDSLIQGHWASDDDVVSLPDIRPPAGSTPGDVQYGEDATYYLWRTWVPSQRANGLELQITYPGVTFPEPGGSAGTGEEKAPMTYLFRQRLSRLEIEGQLLDDAITSEPVEGQFLLRVGSKVQELVLPQKGSLNVQS